MTEDLRDSLKLWGGGIAFLGSFWLALHFDLLDGVTDKVPDNWWWLAVGLLSFANMARLGWGLWQRRASNPRNPNRR
jgi:hypothetical protein